MTTAAIYLRASSDKQETSVADQRVEVERYAAQYDYQVVGVYTDDGVSGWKSQEREGFTRLIADAEAGRFAVILTWDQDRFSRFDPLEASFYWHRLNVAGVRLETVTHGRIDWNDLGGLITTTVAQHAKAQYCRDLAKNVVRGVTAKRKAGIWIGKAPLGYRIGDDGRLALGDPAAIALVRRIFAMRAQGQPLNAIAKTLNAEGVPTPRGVAWRTQSVRSVLDRDTYLGGSSIGKHSAGRFAKVERTEVHDTHPAIVDRDTWDRVQAIPKTMRDNGRGGGEGGALSGLVYCARCGSKMYAFKSGKRVGYSCSGQTGNGSAPKCGCCRVDRDTLDELVLAAIRDRVLQGSRDRLEAAVAKLLEQDRARARQDNGKADRDALAKLEQQIERATDNLVLLDPSLVPGAQGTVQRLVAERDQLKARVAHADRTRRPLPSVKEVTDQLWRLPQVVQHGGPGAARGALSQIVERVELHFDLDPTRGTAKRRRFTCTGGTVVLRHATKGAGPFCRVSDLAGATRIWFAVRPAA